MTVANIPHKRRRSQPEDDFFRGIIFFTQRQVRNRNVNQR
jgi:hypothetical protein